MNSSISIRPKWAVSAAIVAILFGVLTIFSGGRALFGSAAAQAAVGDAVPFVLWFNFIAGFLYVIAGLGLFLWRQWAAPLALFIAVATAVVLAAFGLYVAMGNAFEIRTVGAMVLRNGVWIAIAIPACRAFGCRFQIGAN